MYSETENILNGKKKEKFRQRAVALRRVSVVLCIFGLLKLGISGMLWRDNVTMGEHAKTLS
jgi:hypothetical protein